MPSESPTGRGATQGSNSYRPDDVAREERERPHPPGCTCWNSDFWMDINACPVHGIGCA